MNDPGDIPLTLSKSVENNPCSLTSIIPVIGMSSCRGRAEAFARKLSSKLRTLGSQGDEERELPEDEPIINGISKNTWMPVEDSETVTELQPVRNETDTYFDFDCELESPGSPVEECMYLRLVDTVSNTPHISTTESGYACQSATSSHSSSYSNVLINEPNSEKSCASQNSHVPLPELINISPKNHEVNKSDNEFEISAQLQNEQELNATLYSFPISNTNTLQPNQPNQSDIPNTQECCNSTQNLIEINNFSNDLDAVHYNRAIDETENTASESVTEPDHSINSINSDRSDGPLLALPPTVDICNESQIPDISKDDDGNECQAIGENFTKNIIIDNKLHSTSDVTDDEDECRPQRVRRCSSLKTGKTPPGTPGRKKIVRFADVLGLDLADVKTFLDEVPTIPKSAFMDLEIMDSEQPLQLGPKVDKILIPLFQQPGGLPTFLDIVREKQVSLENASVTDILNQTITGTVRVRNLDFHKSVYLRYSLDNWRSFADLQANYVENSCDGFSDKFSFVIFGNSLQIGQRLEIAVRFQCKGQQYWDNNYGANYCFQCLSTGNSIANPIPPFVPPNIGSNGVGLLSPTAGEAWCCSFY